MRIINKFQWKINKTNLLKMNKINKKVKKVKKIKKIKKNKTKFQPLKKELMKRLIYWKLSNLSKNSPYRSNSK